MREILKVAVLMILFSIFTSCAPDYYKIDELVDWEFLLDILKIGIPILIVGIIILLIPNVILAKFRKDKDAEMKYSWIFYIIGAPCIVIGLFILFPLFDYIKFVAILLFVVIIVVAIIVSIISHFLKK